MAGKRIVFSTATPNDQGGIIPNGVIDFSRFKSNPVILCQHRWEEPPLGLMTDIRLEGDKWTGIPVFNKITEESKKYAALYEGGWIKACSIGGEAAWKTNAAGQYVMDKNGFRQCVSFMLYEISIVSLPSNMDAVQEDAVELGAKIYESGELSTISSKMTTLSSQFNKDQMEKTQQELEADKKAVQTAAAEKPAAEAPKNEQKTTLSAEPNKTELKSDTPGVNELPGFLKQIVGFMQQAKEIFSNKEVTTNAAPEKPAAPVVALAAPAPKDEPKCEMVDPTQPQPTPTGLSAKDVESARAKAETAVEKAKELKAKAEKDDATEEDKAAAKKAMEAAEKACNEAEQMEADYKAKEDSKKEKSTNSATSKKPEMKSIETLKSELKLAPTPEVKAKVGKFNGVSFTELSSPKNEDGKRILGRVMTKGQEKDFSDYEIVLKSILQDERFSALKDKVRIMENVDERRMATYQSKPNTRAGKSLIQLAAQLESGVLEMMGRDNVMRQITKLNSSDDALATPALTAIEWLSLAIFKLFPSTGWKSSIPIFGAQETGNNLGIIWANIAADPTITKGAKPVAPADYNYTDDAVALKLVPYWLQPMIWTPLTMHQLRYDQMATGWAQAFAKWGAIMDDDMIYTLASTVPAGSILLTEGGAFSITGATDPNSFYYNSGFVGDLAKPQLSDIIRLEQVFNKQNFDLETERPILVMDPTMDAFISRDPDAKSLLTRWVDSNNAEIVKFKHTALNQRSRVAIYDPATQQIKDNEAAIPGTAVSAGVCFIPSQVGMGIGMMDVFMIQDPSAYGHRMSADIRIGIVPLRKNYDGTAVLTYGTPTV